MINYFSNKVFIDEDKHYPHVFWGTMSYYIEDQRGHFRNPEKPKPPEPPGCIASIFSRNLVYKESYEYYLKELDKYNILCSQNKIDLERLFDLHRNPQRHLREFDDIVGKILSGVKDKLWDCQNNKMGLVEAEFLGHLNKYFKGEILINKSIDEPTSMNRTFIPDFIFAHNNSKLRIDIEIDEPYSLETRQPIHYWFLEERKYREILTHTDTYRNDYFKFKGWFILRFTEEQAVKEPGECCHLIADFIELITKDSKYQKKISTSKYPTNTRAWALNHCINLERISYRERYLNMPIIHEHLVQSADLSQKVETITNFLKDIDLNLVLPGSETFMKYQIFKTNN